MSNPGKPDGGWTCPRCGLSWNDCICPIGSRPRINEPDFILDFVESLPATIPSVRIKFEAVCKSKNWCNPLYKLERMDHDGYLDNNIQKRWEAWEAAWLESFNRRKTTDYAEYWRKQSEEFGPACGMPNCDADKPCSLHDAPSPQPPAEATEPEEASIWPLSIVDETEPDEPVAYLYRVREVGKQIVEFAAVDGWRPTDPAKEVIVDKWPLYLRPAPSGEDVALGEALCGFRHPAAPDVKCLLPKGHAGDGHTNVGRETH